MKKLVLLLAAVTMLFASCVRITNIFDQVDNRLDKIEETVQSIDEQIESINTQLSSLKEIDEAIKRQIEELESNGSADSKEIADLKEKDAALEESISKLQEYVDSQISKAVNDAAAAYATIEQYNNIIDKLTALTTSTNKLGEELTTKISNEVKALTDIITDLENRLKAVEDQVKKLLARIQSVSYIPEYSDGMVSVDCIGNYSSGTMSFRLSPKECIAELAQVWQTALTCEAVYTKSRAASLTKMAVSQFETDEENGVITVSFLGDNLSKEFFAGQQSASVALVISDGNTSITSEYIPMFANEITDEIWYTTTDGNIVEPNRDESNDYADDITLFGANIISNTYENGKGIIKFDNDPQHLGEWAFKEKSSLKTIILPNSITILKKRAFDLCSNLVYTDLSKSLTKIETGCFARCSKLRTITPIPEGVTYIGQSAFMYAPIENFYGKFTSDDHKCLIYDNETDKTLIALANISGDYILPSDITALGNLSMTEFQAGCTITIPDSIEKIDDSSINSAIITSSHNLKAIYGKFASADNRCLIYNNILYGTAAYGLTKFEVPEGVTFVRQLTFQNLSKLNSITFPASLTKISFYTMSCKNLKHIYIKAKTPPTISSNKIKGDSYLYSYCTPIIFVPSESVESYKQAAGWKDVAEYIKPYNEDLTSITYTSTDGQIVTPTNYNIDTFGANPISNTYKDGVGTITFDDIVTTIGSQAFTNCETLKSINIPGSVWNLGYKCFESCINMEDINIPEGVTQISNLAFHWCHKLESIKLPSTVISIAEKSFFNAVRLKYIYSKYSHDNNQSLIFNNKLIWVSMHIEGDYKIPEGITHLGNYCIAYPLNVITITIPNSVETVSDYPFVGAKTISAFYGKFATGTHREAIAGDHLFGVAAYGLSEYSIPEGVKTMAYRMFRCCEFTKFTFPSSTTALASNLFEDCTKLKTVYCKATTPPTFGDDVFLDCSELSAIYVPAASLAEYKAANGWKNYATKIYGYEF